MFVLLRKKNVSLNQRKFNKFNFVLYNYFTIQKKYKYIPKEIHCLFFKL